jgi:hypothetical protein
MSSTRPSGELYARCQDPRAPACPQVSPLSSSSTIGRPPPAAGSSMGNPLAALSSLAKRAKGEGGASASAPGSQASGPARYFEEKFKPDEIKPEQGVEDPRKEENSPSTVGGIVRRYYLKTADLLKRVPSATYHFTTAAVRSAPPHQGPGPGTLRCHGQAWAAGGSPHNRGSP